MNQFNDFVLSKEYKLKRVKIKNCYDNGKYLEAFIINFEFINFTIVDINNLNIIREIELLKYIYSGSNSINRQEILNYLQNLLSDKFSFIKFIMWYMLKHERTSNEAIKKFNQIKKYSHKNIHFETKCNGFNCNQNPIFGNRYQTLNLDKNYCEECFNNKSSYSKNCFQIYNRSDSLPICIGIKMDELEKNAT
tara:strand:+ start:2877 stop:3455 length:579 start_codon:yes stop_codon:yes gene_type:complete